MDGSHQNGGRSCRRCQHVNLAAATFCSHCGFQLGAAVTVEEFRQRLNTMQALFQQGQTERAEAGLKLLLQHENEESRLAATYSCLGVIYSRTGRGSDAVAAFYAAVQQTPRSAAAYYKLGEACRANGLLREAIECFHVASRLDPNLAQAKDALQATQQERDNLVRSLSAEFPDIRKANDVTRMKAHCQRVLSLDPYHLVAGNLLTEIWEADGEHIPAMRLSKLLARKYPQATAFQERCRRLQDKVGPFCEALDLAEQARRQLQRGDSAAALGNAQAAVNADRTDPEVLVTLALALELEGQWIESRKIFQEALKINGRLKAAREGEHRVRHKELARRREVVADHLGEANRFLREKQFSQATAAVQKASEFLADDPLIPFLRGRIAFEQGDLYGAAGHFENAVECDRAFKPAVRSLIAVRVRLDKKLEQQTLFALKEARRIPNSGETIYVPDVLGEAKNVLQARRKFYVNKAAAIPFAKRRDRFFQQEFDVYVSLGQFYERQNRLTNAVEEYQVLVKLQPRNVKARKLWEDARGRLQQIVKTHLDRATRHRKAKDYDKAVREIERALVHDPGSLVAMIHLGIVYEYARQFEMAIEVYEGAQKLYPNSEQVKTQLTAARDRAKKFKQAQSRQKTSAAMTVARVAIRLAG